MNETAISAIISALLAGGGVATLTTLFRGVQTLRGGARARERETITTIVTSRDEAIEREASALRDSRYWQSIAGRYSYQLRAHGVNPDPQDPIPPSEGAT